MVRQVMCYICREPFSCKELPKKCADCGESVFVNLEFLIQSFEMYGPPAKVKKEEVKEELLTTFSAEEVEANIKDINVFSGFAYQDHEDDVDMFSYIEADEYLVFDGLWSGFDDKKIYAKFVENNYLYSTTPRAYVMVAFDQNNVRLGHIRGYFDQIAYQAGQVVYGTKSLLVNCDNTVRVKIYSNQTALADELDVRIEPV